MYAWGDIRFLQPYIVNGGANIPTWKKIELSKCVSIWLKITKGIWMFYKCLGQKKQTWSQR
jgi:hypothetical protein